MKNPETKGVVFDFGGTLMYGAESTRKDLIPGLEALRAADMRLGIVSLSTEANIKKELSRAGVRRFFEADFIIGHGSARDILATVKEREKAGGLLGRLGVHKLVDRDKLELAALAMKPNPMAVEYMMRKWELSSAEVAFIGDDPSDDGGCAAAAGVRFYMIPEILREDVSLLEFLQTNGIV